MKTFLKVFLCIIFLGMITLCVSTLLVSTDTVKELSVRSSGEQSVSADPEHQCNISISLISGGTCGLVFSGISFLLRRFIKWRKKKKLNVKKDQLRRQSGKAREDLDALLVDLTQLNELRTGLERQFLEGYRFQIQEIEREMERNEKKVKEVEVKIENSERKNTTDITEGYLQEQQRLLEAQGELEKTKNELEEKKLEAIKLLQKTDKIKESMTRRRRSKENFIVSINSQLGEGENVDENVPLLV